MATVPLARRSNAGAFLFPAPRYSHAMPTLFDPLAWLRSKGAVASLDSAGEVQILFDQCTSRETRERIKRTIFRYYRPLLRMQLDVPDGTRPRTVQQLVASGRLRVVEGRYRV